MAKLTVEEKRDVIVEKCRKFFNCSQCVLQSECREVDPMKPPARMNDRQIEKLYQFVKPKGEPTMNENALNVTKAEEKTITIAVSEYRFLISEQSTLSKLEGYAETHEYLSDDVIRALLGVEKPAANLESEGD